MASRQSGIRPPAHDVVVAPGERRVGIGAATVRRAVFAVLRGERARPATISVTFLSGQQMRALHRRTLRADRATDVLAFGLQHDGRLVGDVYVCPSVAGRAARRLGIPVRDELVRLVIHGTLHALGHDHPPGEERLRSPMWQRQERYVRRVLRRKP